MMPCKLLMNQEILFPENDDHQLIQHCKRARFCFTNTIVLILIAFNRRKFILLFLISIGLSSCTKDPAAPNPDFTEEEYYAGGATTVFDVSSAAFSGPATNLTAERLLLHMEGDAAFEATFVTAPAPVNSGLGPVYNQSACNSCHVLDGRGAEPSVFRLSKTGFDTNGGPLTIPGFGGQLQNLAVASVVAEGEVLLQYEALLKYFDDGDQIVLQQPIYSFINFYQPLPNGFHFSPRVAPPVFGLGLLEAIDEEDILKYADPFDLDKDGISGKPNYVWNQETLSATLGRFGWKANQPSLLQQTAAAYNEDMGITNKLFPEESSKLQIQYDGLQDDVELTDDLLNAATFYVQTIAVPAPRNLDDPEVLAGKRIFMAAKCNSCHVPRHQTGFLTQPELANQIIYPYTDLLLHDMGMELADNRPDFQANGSEWRTPPLWGIGLTQIVNGHQRFLHDGRAGSLMEAIMWHGGEATGSRDYVKKASQKEREQLIKFLEAL